MKKKDLTDVTFCIPFRNENPDRIANLQLVVDYLLFHFNTTIIIGKSDKQPWIFHTEDNSWFKSSWNKKVYYHPHTEKKDLFHKTLLLNNMVKQCKTKYVVAQDADCLFLPDNYIMAIDSLRKNKNRYFAYPFNKGIVNISKDRFNILSKKNNLNSLGLQYQIQEVENSNNRFPPGGCFFFHKKKFIECGMENEMFKNYGVEDQERLDRIRKLGYGINYVKGVLFHLDHAKSNTSTNKNEFFNNNNEIFYKEASMSRDELIKYIKKEFKWLKK